MKRKESKTIQLRKIFKTLFEKISVMLILVVGIIFFGFPLFWMISTSLKTTSQLNLYPPLFWPKPAMWKNYVEALNFLPFGLFFKNTLIIAIFFVIGNLLSCTFIAYGFARFRFPGRNILFIILISTMMIPLVVRLIPLFILFKKLGWINTYYPFIVPAFFGDSFFIFLIRQFYRSIPFDISNAALIDGCSHIGVWWRIMIPMSKPVLAAVTIFAFQRVWNDFLAPLIFLTKTEMKTLSVGLQAFTGGVSTTVELWNLLMAATTVFVLPVIIIFIFAQKYFVKGITMTGLRG